MLRPIPSAASLTLSQDQLDALLLKVFCLYNGFPMTALDRGDSCTFIPVRGCESSVGGFVRRPLAVVLQ